MSGAKISVIVPVYKVEPYLNKCLDSIVDQTYQNLEIILVDDGSPDNCGAICDEYAAKDNRIQVIHQENRGVSSARNAGLAVVTGEWIGWVDSDDWIEPDMYEYLLDAAQQAGADIAVCGQVEEYPGRQVCRTWAQREVHTAEESLELLLQNGVLQNSLCDKLWRRELFAPIQFPQGHRYEDLAVAYRLFARANRLVCLPDAKYHYLQHSDSFLGGRDLGSRVDSYLAAQERYVELREIWPQFCELLVSQCVDAAVSVWGAYLFNPPQIRKAFQKQIGEIAAFSKEHYSAVRRHTSLGRIGRAVRPLTQYPTWWAFVLAGIWNWAYAARHSHSL